MCPDLTDNRLEYFLKLLIAGKIKMSHNFLYSDELVSCQTNAIVTIDEKYLQDCEWTDISRPTIRPGLAGTDPVSKMFRNFSSMKFSKLTSACDASL